MLLKMSFDDIKIDNVSIIITLKWIIYDQSEISYWNTSAEKIINLIVIKNLHVSLNKLHNNKYSLTITTVS